MLAYLSAAALLMLAGMSQALVIVDDVKVNLVESKSTQGEQFYLSSSVHDISITCRAYTNGSFRLTTSSFTWRKTSSWANATISDARTPISVDIAGDGFSGQSVLKINYPVKADFTSYMCIVNQTGNATGSFVSVPLLTISVNGINEYDSAHWPGENLAIYCVVDGYPVGDIRWTKSMDPTFSVTNNNTIYMNSVSYDTDRGYVTCSSNNSIGSNRATVFLRIKNTSSYLAPLIATIVELGVMAVIAAGYELWDRKRRCNAVADGVKSD